nr:immunoglobulin light chain junction region [Macaca mulatta]
CQHYYGAPYSF